MNSRGRAGGGRGAAGRILTLGAVGSLVLGGIADGRPVPAGLWAPADHRGALRHLEAGELDAAVARLQRGRTARGPRGALERDLGILLLEGGRLDEAEAVFRDLLSRSGPAAAADHHYHLALIHLRREAWDSAFAAARASLGLRPGAPDARTALLLAREGMRRDSLAQEDPGSGAKTGPGGAAGDGGRSSGGPVHGGPVPGGPEDGPGTAPGGLSPADARRILRMVRSQEAGSLGSLIQARMDGASGDPAGGLPW